jgi:DNA-binding NarL/FixJ family response regulator
MPNEKVLVIDDDPDVLQLVKDCLAEAGYEVLTVVDASAAGQLARDERPDAVIVDLDSSAAEGRDICKMVKGDSILKHTPVIFIQQKPSLQEKVEGFAVGAHDFMEKPFDGEELTARVDSAVRLKLAMDRLRKRNARLETLARHVQTAVQHYEQPRSRQGAAGEKDTAGKTAARLTRRELEILQLLAQGLSNEVISRQLFISPTTTRNHIQNILGKLGVHSKLEAVAYAVRAGYVDFVG